MIFENQTEHYGKHYLYLHVRMDKNEVFYVGIGTKYKHKKDYSRAKAKGSQRNSYWRDIVSSTDYKVLIAFEDDDYSIIKEKEKSLISIYGRLCDNTGSLCNLSIGGDGCLGYRNKNIMKPVYVYHKNGKFFMEFESVSDCGKYLGAAATSVGLSIDKNHLIKSYILKSYKTDKVEPILDIKEKLKKRLSKPVYQYDLENNFIREWPSSSEAARCLKLSGGHIREMAKGSTIRKQVGNFIWKY